MDKAPFKLEQWFSGVSVFLILFDGILNELASEGVFELSRDNGKAIQEDRYVQRVLILLAIFELSNYGEPVLTIQL